MVEHVSGRITLGGELPRSRVGALWRVVSEDQAGPEWGVPFGDVAELTAHLREGGGVTFYGDEVPSGEFRGIEAFCVGHGLSYLLTYDGCGGEWGPARRRWRPGEREGVTCSLDADGGRACVTADDIRALGLQDVGAVLAHLQAFDDATSPALHLVDG